MMTKKRMLGLDLAENSIRIAEADSAGGALRVARAEEFLFPEGVSWQEPVQLGRALDGFLRKAGFSTRRAALGLPGEWLMAREVAVPPAPPAATAEMVRIQAEREFSAEPGDVAMDFADSGESERARSTLLVAVMRNRLEQAVAMARAARLSARAVTSTALVVAAASGDSSASCAITLLRRASGADIVARSGPDYRTLTHVSLQGGDGGSAAGAPETLVSELRRALAGAACRLDAGTVSQLTICDETGLMSGAAAELSSEFGLQTRLVAGTAELSGRLKVGDGKAGSASFIAAAALAVAGISAKRPPVDWLRSRLAPQKGKWGPRQKWAVAAGAAVAIAALVLMALWWQGRSDLGQLKRRLAGLQGSLAEAQAIADKLAPTRGWYDNRPRALDALRALSAAFPPEGRAYITNITVRPIAGIKKVRGSLIAKSSEERAALETFDRLKASAGFSDPQLLYVRAAGRNSREVAFAISFTFSAVE